MFLTLRALPWLEQTGYCLQAALGTSVFGSALGAMQIAHTASVNQVAGCLQSRPADMQALHWAQKHLHQTYHIQTHTSSARLPH